MPPRTHRGRRSLRSLAARLPPWARDLYHRFREEELPDLRRAVTALRDLLTLLEATLKELQAQEVDLEEDKIDCRILRR